MISKRSLITSVLMTLLVIAHTSLTVRSQEPATSNQTSEGVKLYEQGETDGAIKALREAVMIHGDDAKAWHYLGLALIRKSDLKEAREALRKAIEFRSLAFNRFFNFGLNEVRDDQLVRLKTLLHDEVESERKYLETLSDTSSIGFTRATLEGLDARSDCLEQNTKVTDGHSIFLKSDLKIQRPHILSKPPPQYSADARKHETRGTVRLKVVFAADGSIKFIDVIQPLGHGLSEEAVKAAARISFEPASICGKRVSWAMELEYSFNIWRRY